MDAVDEEVPDFGRPPADAAVDLAIDDEAAADAAADGDVEDRRHAAARAVECFAQARDIGVVADERGNVKVFGEPRREREVVPAGDLVRGDDRARGVVGGTAEADADGLQRRVFDAGSTQ